MHWGPFCIDLAPKHTQVRNLTTFLLRLLFLYSKCVDAIRLWRAFTCALQPRGSLKSVLMAVARVASVNVTQTLDSITSRCWRTILNDWDESLLVTVCKHRFALSLNPCSCAGRIWTCSHVRVEMFTSHLVTDSMLLKSASLWTSYMKRASSTVIWSWTTCSWTTRDTSSSQTTACAR